jgi:hypothetical protein
VADDTQTVQVSAGRDRWVKITGPSAFLTALVVLLIAVVGYLMHFNLQSWGEPFPIKNLIEEHMEKSLSQHSDITLALRWNTYVQWACSPNNFSGDARKKCSEVDLMKPEPEDPTRRRYRIRPE